MTVYHILILENEVIGQVWWHSHAIPALQKDSKFEARVVSSQFKDSQGYIMRPSIPQGQEKKLLKV